MKRFVHKLFDILLVLRCEWMGHLWRLDATLEQAQDVEQFKALRAQARCVYCSIIYARAERWGGLPFVEHRVVMYVPFAAIVPPSQLVQIEKKSA